MLDFPLHFPGTNATLPWTHTEMSAAVVLVALTVVMLTCCGAAALVMVACCGGRRRDTVGETGDSRWLPGVGVIDYVPTSNRSSIRVSLVMSESTDGPMDDPRTTSTHLSDTTTSNSSVSLALTDAETLVSPPHSFSAITLPAVSEEVEPDSDATSMRSEFSSSMLTTAVSTDDASVTHGSASVAVIVSSELSAPRANLSQDTDKLLTPDSLPSMPSFSSFYPSSDNSGDATTTSQSPQVSEDAGQCLKSSVCLKDSDESSLAPPPKPEVITSTSATASDQHCTGHFAENSRQDSELYSVVDKLPDVPQASPQKSSMSGNISKLLPAT